MTPRSVLALIAAAWLVASCSTAGAPSQPPASGSQRSPTPASPTRPPTAAPIDLDGRAFLSTSVTADGVPRPLVQGTRIRLDFRDNRLGASAGCNTMGASYAVVGTALRISDAATTEMGCDAARHEQDEWLFGFLGSTPTVEVDGEVLTLRSGTTVITLLDREVAEPDLPLVGVTWTLETIVSGETASSVPAGVRPTIRFSGDGTITVDTGCNQGIGTWRASGDLLTVSALGLTKRACLGDAGMVEAAVLGVLQAPSIRVEIDASVLRLRAAEEGLDFRG